MKQLLVVLVIVAAVSASVGYYAGNSIGKKTPTVGDCVNSLVGTK